MTDKLRIEYMALSDLKRHPRNPKDHDRGAIAKSISRFGYVTPILIDERSGYIVAGHGRIDTLADMQRKGEQPPARIQVNDSGDWLVPVMRGISFNSDSEVEAYLVADNRLTELGGWHEVELAGLLQDLAAENTALLEATGYDGDDLDALLAELNNPPYWNPDEDTSNPAGDGINDTAGYSLSSFWKDLPRDNEVSPHFLTLPPVVDSRSGSTFKAVFSRTNATETERIVRTYMRPGDRFFEMCCGWMTFSSTAKFYGYSGLGCDIWDTSLRFCKRQLEAMPGDGDVRVIYADCRDTKQPDNHYDFLHSNPPFFSLEVYGGSDDDLASSNDYEAWLGAMGDMAKEAERILKPGGLANFVMNDFRKDGVLVPMATDFMNSALKNSGLKLHDLVVAEVQSQAMRFRKKVQYPARYTVKCHEYIFTFIKQ